MSLGLSHTRQGLSGRGESPVSICRALILAQQGTGADRREALDVSASRLVSLLWRPDCRGPSGVLSQCSPTRAPENHARSPRIAN